MVNIFTMCIIALLVCYKCLTNLMVFFLNKINDLVSLSQNKGFCDELGGIGNWLRNFWAVWKKLNSIVVFLNWILKRVSSLSTIEIIDEWNNSFYCFIFFRIISMNLWSWWLGKIVELEGLFRVSESFDF